MKGLIKLLSITLIISLLTGCSNSSGSKIPVSSEWKYEDGSMYQEETFDEKGNVIKEISYSDGEITGYYLHEYNAEGKMIYNRGYNEDNSYSYGGYTEYDENNYPVKYYDLDENDKKTLECSYENEVDKEGHLTKQTTKYAEDENQNLNCTTVFTYDDKGRLIKEDMKYTDPFYQDYNSYTEYKYGDSAEWIESHTYETKTKKETNYNKRELDKDNRPIKYIYTSDEDGKLTEKTINITYKY